MLDGLEATQILEYYGLGNAAIISSISPLQDVESSQKRLILWPRLSASARGSLAWNQKLGIALIVVALGAFVAAYWPMVKLETSYQIRSFGEQMTASVKEKLPFLKALQVAPVPVVEKKPEFDPLIDPNGQAITPASMDFSLIVPKVGINAVIIPGVNPVSDAGYLDALKKGVAHASTSYFPNENGTVYLFSHSTNYEWFIDDLNAVFYHLKNIEPGELVVIMYQGNRYTYRIREQRVITAKEISYLVPQPGVRTLILQTCWPPGSTWKRLLIFADLIDEQTHGSFNELMI